MRPAFATLWNLDFAFADIVSTSTQPALGAIRMAWWRERLEELDSGAAPPDEPRLKAIKRQLLGRGISGLELSRLEDAWLPLLEPFPWSEPQTNGLRLRGRILFGVGARLLGGIERDAEAAGVLWSLIDGANHCSDPDSRELLVAEARAAAADMAGRTPKRIRSLTVLGALAAYDLRPGGRLGRVGISLAHRLRGSMPRS